MDRFSLMFQELIDINVSSCKFFEFIHIGYIFNQLFFEFGIHLIQFQNQFRILILFSFQFMNRLNILTRHEFQFFAKVLGSIILVSKHFIYILESLFELSNLIITGLFQILLFLLNIMKTFLESSSCLGFLFKFLNLVLKLRLDSFNFLNLGVQLLSFFLQ